MSTVAWPHRVELSPSFANAALRRAARLWFMAAVLGQWIFAFYVAVFYGTLTAQGGLEAWNKALFRGYILGDTIGNTLLVLHLLLAVIILVGGPLQFSAKIRRRAPAFHRWNGRVYMVSVIVASVGGTYMMWVRRTLGDNVQHAAQTLDAILIVAFAVAALRYAMARNFGTHRRWALRLFLAGNAIWFKRVGFQLWMLLHGGRPVGFDTKTFSGPFLSIWEFGSYLLPLALLEIYLWTEKRAGERGRLVTATVLVLATVAMSIGIFLVSKGWLSRL
jgi:hypothetical protein